MKTYFVLYDEKKKKPLWSENFLTGDRRTSLLVCSVRVKFKDWMVRERVSIKTLFRYLK